MLKRRGFRGHWGRALISTGVLLLGASPALAQAPAKPLPSHVRAKPTSTSIAVKADARLPEGTARFGVKLAFWGRGVLVSSCVKFCKSSAYEERVVVPDEAVSLARSVETLTLGDGTKALLVSYGGEGKHYSLVVLGAERGQDQKPSAPPQIVFRGWSEPQKARLSLHKKGDTVDLYVLGPDQPLLCGRALPESAQRLDAARGRFGAVRLPPLGAAERKAAQPLASAPFVAGAKDALLHLGFATSLGSLSDGRVDISWDRPYGVEQLPTSPLAPDMDWVVELKEPLKEDAILYLASEKQVWELTLSPHAGKRYVVAIPEGLSCATWVQGASATPIVEVWGRVKSKTRVQLPALIAALDNADPGWAPASIVPRGEAGELALKRAFPRLSPRGRERALQVALSSPWGATTLAVALDVGSEEVAERAEEALLRGGRAEADAIAQRLKRAKASSVQRLSATLFRLDPALGARKIIQGLGHVSRARREAYRENFVRLFAANESRAPFETLLFEKGQFSDLGIRAQVNVVRSLSTSFDLTPIKSQVLELARQADFEAAYLLVRPLAARSTHLESGPIVRGWLSGDAPRNLSSSQRAALRVHVIEALLETDAKALPTGLIAGLLKSENMRVRRSAGSYLKRHPDAEAAADLSRILKKEKWPDVRIEAAEALGQLIGTSTTKLDAQQRAELHAFLIRRLRREEEPLVRRALVRGLVAYSSEETRRALRKSLRKDDSYEVRREAALALGRLCDQDSASELTELALKLVSGEVDEGAIALSLAAISALAHLAPGDLETRLAPLLSKQVAGPVRARIVAQLTAVGPTCSEARPQD